MLERMAFMWNKCLLHLIFTRNSLRLNYIPEEEPEGTDDVPDTMEDIPGAEENNEENAENDGVNAEEAGTTSDNSE